MSLVLVRSCALHFHLLHVHPPSLRRSAPPTTSEQLQTENCINVAWCTKSYVGNWASDRFVSKPCAWSHVSKVEETVRENSAHGELIEYERELEIKIMSA